MTAIPSGTKFIGISPNVPTPENRSSLSNSYQETYTIDDIVAEATALDTNIYNTDGTLDGNRTVDLDGNTIKFDDGKVGINVTPAVPLHVKSIAIPSTNEDIVRLEVSDAPGAYLAFNNASTIDGVFLPHVVGRQSSSNNQSAIIQGGYIDTTQDSGSSPVTVFRSALATLTQVVTRPIFAFRNWSTTVMTILANGNVGIGTATPGEKLEIVGKVKAETIQLTTGAGANKYLVSDASGNGSWVNLPTSEVISASDETTALTTGTAKVTFRMPYAMNVTAVRASLSTAQTSGNILTVDINEGGNSILSTKLTIDNTEKTSTTAATPAVISDSALADDAEITIDIDQIGDGTAAGLKVVLIGTRA
jgi:hypothetical protein